MANNYITPKQLQMSMEAVKNKLNTKANTSHGTHVSFGTSTSSITSAQGSPGASGAVSRADHTHTLNVSADAIGALPLTGGTLSNSAFGGSLNIKRLGTYAAAIKFSNDYGTLGFLAMSAVNGSFFRYDSNASTNHIILDTKNMDTHINLESLGAASKSHVHNYAASKSAGGAATKAEALSTPRSISVSGAVSGTCTSFDGSANATISTTLANIASNKITAMTSYGKPTTTSAITTSDSLNTAIGKLEKGLEGKQNAGSYAPLSHNHSNATTSTSGYMSSTDKTKLDGVASGANNYVHPNTSGSIHIPSGGSSGQFLGWSASGTAKWVSNPNTDNKVENYKSNTTKAYVTGSESSVSNYGREVFDTGVYLGTTEGSLYASSFNGPLNGNATTATSSTKATQDSSGQTINSTYIKGLSVSGKTITYTRGNGTTGTITTQDTNTTYGVGSGTTLGLTKLYTSVGSATDGTMTRSALTTAFGEKADRVHGHTNATTSTSGYMSNADKNKLDNLKISGHNLICNGSTEYGTDYWDDIGGGITIHKSTKGNCFKSSFPGAFRHKDWIQLKPNTDYIYCAYFNSDKALTTSNITPLHFWINEDKAFNTDTACMDIIKYDQTPIANAWKKLYVHFRTKDVDPYFKPMIYTNNQTSEIYVMDIGLYEGNTLTEYSMSPQSIRNEIRDLKIGGRNLVRESTIDYQTVDMKFDGTDNKCHAIGKIYLRGVNVGDRIKTRLVLKYNGVSATTGKSPTVYIQGSGDVTDWAVGTTLSSERHTLSIASGDHWYVFSFTTTINEGMLQNNYFNCGFRFDGVKTGNIWWKQFKSEKGDYHTDWSPAPEDLLEIVGNEAISYKKIVIPGSGELMKLGSNNGGSDAWINFGYPESEFGWKIKYVGSTNSSDGNEFRIESNDGNYFQVDHDMNLDIKKGAATYKVWHSGNDGSGTGLDADLLDGKHASSFALASHSHAYVPVSYNGNINIQADADTNGAGEYLGLKAGKNVLMVKSNGASTHDKYLYYNDHEVFHQGNRPVYINTIVSSTLFNSTNVGDGRFAIYNTIYKSTAGLFPHTDNSNAILAINRHPGDYESQLGFSSNGGLYYRKFQGGKPNATTGWDRLLTNNYATIDTTLKVNVPTGTNFITYGSSAGIQRMTDQNGLGMYCESTMILHAGDSMPTVKSNAGITNGYTGEELYLTTDGDIKLITGLQNGWDTRKQFHITSGGDTYLPGKLHFKAEATDSASIGTTISGSTTYFDFNLADDTADTWRWMHRGVKVMELTNTSTSSNTARLNVAGYFCLNGKKALSGIDSWCRINDSHDFTSGVYFGGSLIRTDGQIHVGDGGSTFKVTTSELKYKGNNIYHTGYKPNTIDSLGAQNAQTGRTQVHDGIYTYNTRGSSNGGPTAYTSVIGFGDKGLGYAEIAAEWTDGQGLWVRSLRDVDDNWWNWERVITSKLVYSGTGSGVVGTMSQKAITDALSGKAATSHTHSYYLNTSGGTVSGTLKCSALYIGGYRLTISSSAPTGQGTGDIWIDI